MVGARWSLRLQAARKQEEGDDKIESARCDERKGRGDEKDTNAMKNEKKRRSDADRTIAMTKTMMTVMTAKTATHRL